MSESITGYPSIDRPWLNRYPKELIDDKVSVQSIYDYLRECNKDNLETPALNYFGKKLTYRQFFNEIETAALAFRAVGVKEGDIVTVVSLSCVRSVVCMYALNKIGAMPSYINVLALENECVTYFTEARSRLVITLDVFADKVVRAAHKSNVETVLVYSMADDAPAAVKAAMGIKMRGMDKSFYRDSLVLTWKAFIAKAEGQPAIEYVKDGNTGAFFGHTGGTTGFPKNVILADHPFNIIASFSRKVKAGEPGDIFLSGMIPYVIYSTIVNIHMPLCYGYELVLIPKFDPAEWHKYIRKYRPNHCYLIPAYAQGMLNNKKVSSMDLSCFKTFGVGGEGMTLTLERDFNNFLKQHKSPAYLRKGYGMTELCALDVVENGFARKLGSVGVPLPQNNVMIYDNDAQQECKYNVNGEICLQCATAMLGYQDNPEEEKNLIRIHPDGSRWFHTGDLGYVDEEGFLFVVGRLKRMIMTVIDGKVYKIPPQNVENVIATDTDVREVCVIRASDGYNKVLKAIVVPKEGRDTEAMIKRLRDLCNKELQDNMRPSFYEISGPLPRTPAGKVDFVTLEKECV